MVDLVQILEEEAAGRKKLTRWLRICVAVVVLLTLVSAVVTVLKGKGTSEILTATLPLLALGGIGAAYTPRHKKALQDAIHDPNTALDPHFAEALSAPELEVASMAREAFLKRFEGRLPDLDDSQWAVVAAQLSRGTDAEAEKLLSMLSTAGGVKTIAPVENYLALVKNERLKTATHFTLGSVRLRTARAIVLNESHDARVAQDEQIERLNLSN